MGLVAKLDDLGKPAWIALMVLGFVAFWPIGLAMLFYLIWSGRMGCWTNGNSNRWQRRMERMQEKMDHMQRKAAEWSEQWSGGRRAAPSSGNRAFDEYRDETLRRLEEEQREFHDFLDRLRHAKDKAEFDQFMASRRPRPAENGLSAQNL